MAITRRSRPPSIFPAAAMRTTLNLYDDFGKIKGIAGVLKLWKRFWMWQTSFKCGINSLPLFASVDTGIYPHLASQYHAWPSAVRGIAMLF